MDGTAPPPATPTALPAPKKKRAPKVEATAALTQAPSESTALTQAPSDSTPVQTQPSETTSSLHVFDLDAALASLHRRQSRPSAPM